MKEQWHYIGTNSASILKNWVTKKKYFHCVLSVKSKKYEATYWGLAFYNSNNTIKLKLVKSYKLVYGDPFNSVTTDGQILNTTIELFLEIKHFYSFKQVKQ